MREMRRRWPKSKTAASAVIRRIKPQETWSAISARKKAVEAGLLVDVYGHLRMAAHIVSRDQGFTTAAGNTKDVRDWRSGVTRC